MAGVLAGGDKVALTTEVTEEHRGAVLKSRTAGFAGEESLSSFKILAGLSLKLFVPIVISRFARDFRKTLLRVFYG